MFYIARHVKNFQGQHPTRTYATRIRRNTEDCPHHSALALMNAWPWIISEFNNPILDKKLIR